MCYTIQAIKKFVMKKKFSGTVLIDFQVILRQ